MLRNKKGLMWGEIVKWIIALMLIIIIIFFIIYIKDSSVLILGKLF